jgi:hypothetical protein
MKPINRQVHAIEQLRLLYHLDDASLAPEHLDAWLAWATRSRLQPSSASRARCASITTASSPPSASASPTAAWKDSTPRCA